MTGGPIKTMHNDYKGGGSSPSEKKKKKTMGEMALKEEVRETGSVKLSTKLLKMGIRMVREKREEIKSKV